MRTVQRIGIVFVAASIGCGASVCKDALGSFRTEIAEPQPPPVRLAAAEPVQEATLECSKQELWDLLDRGEAIRIRVGKGVENLRAEVPVRKARSFDGKVSVTIAQDAASLRVSGGTGKPIEIKAREIGERIFQDERAWFDHKSYNDTLFNWLRGSRLDFVEVAPYRKNVCVVFRIAMAFASGGNQVTMARGYFLLSAGSSKPSGIRAWVDHCDQEGDWRSVKLTHRRSGRTFLAIQQSKGAYSILDAKSGSAIVAGLPPVAMGFVGHEALFYNGDLDDLDRGVVAADLGTKKTRLAIRGVEFLDILAPSGSGALFRDFDGNFQYYDLRSGALIPVEFGKANWK